MRCKVTSISQLAQKIGVTRQAVWYWLKKGKIQGYRVGKVWVIPLDQEFPKEVFEGEGRTSPSDFSNTAC